MMGDYDGYNFNRFQELAKVEGISKYEKIGFPDSYRQGLEKLIFEDILAKVPRLAKTRGLNVLDIGPGCSDLPAYLADYCQVQGHTLFQADSPEMLSLTPERSGLMKIAGLFPETAAEIKAQSGGVDVIVCYSVFHYIFVDTNVLQFLDAVLELLNDAGQALIGDIPNISKRKRFFASASGVRFHKEFMQTDEAPVVSFNCPEPGRIDDALLLALVMRCQASGCDAYIVPQAEGLPFANRRDDLLIRKP
jgi:2-polyprenyl-3-methyl-5-hydroxy-6-metoxy-1,4-benzoquinol methylase